MLPLRTAIRSQASTEVIDALIRADPQVAKSFGVSGKTCLHLACLYSMDFDEEDEPVLLLTNYDISPFTGLWVKPVVSILGLSSLTIFSLGAFSMNMDVVDQISKAAQNGEGFNWLIDLSMPIAAGVLCTQLAHEVGHGIVALKDGVSLIAVLIGVLFKHCSLSFLTTIIQRSKLGLQLSSQVFLLD